MVLLPTCPIKAITTQGDNDTVQALLMDIASAHTPASTNLGGSVLYLDRGYGKEGLKSYIRTCHGHYCGTQPRPATVEIFPYTYGHPENFLMYLPIQGHPSLEKLSKGRRQGLQ